MLEKKLRSKTCIVGQGKEVKEQFYPVDTISTI